MLNVVTAIGVAHLVLHTSEGAWDIITGAAIMVCAISHGITQLAERSQK